MSIQRLLSTFSRVLVSKMTFDGSSSAYMPGAVDSAACRLFLKKRMATLDEWLPLKQFLTRVLRQKAQRFERLCGQAGWLLALLAVENFNHGYGSQAERDTKSVLFRFHRACRFCNAFFSFQPLL
ncbi:hypothetical protein [Paraburkholderia xenovorans]|uniref:hypothetical protein n=1 Tax=Paraburkholderia xenovorans TaxID=36873 RepID=UPI0038BDB2E6